MGKLVCFGEVLIDFLNKDNHQDGPIGIQHFHQYPGGAPANAAVAAAKLGGDAWFIGQVGDDQFGHFLREGLEMYGVNTRFLTRHPKAKTPLAFVMLDDDGERHFSFYRDRTADVVLRAADLIPNMFADAHIFHFCSNTLTASTIAHTTEHALNLAKEAGALCSFDVNLRHNLWDTGEADKAVINRVVHQADILKFSKDELEYLSQGDNHNYLSQCLAHGSQLILVTDGAKAIEYFTPHGQGQVAPPNTSVVDTTAGGDAFIGGILFVLSQQKAVEQWLANKNEVESGIGFAAQCGAIAVSRPGAFPALPTFQEVTEKLSGN